MQASAKANDRRIDGDLLDQDSLLERCMGNYALVERLLTRYMDLVSQDCDLLDSAVEGADSATVAQVAHRLKGTSATVGASRTCELAALIEQESAMGDWTLLSSIVSEIRHVHVHITAHYQGSRGSYQRTDRYGGGE